MGTGKSHWGRRLAREFGVPFVDTDAEIVRRAGHSIPEIFATEGEASFRRRELELVRELTSPPLDGCVVAAGGGLAAQREAMDLVLSRAAAVCLTAPAAFLARRLATQSAGRPLLARSPGQSLEDRIAELLSARVTAYARIPVQVDVSADPDSARLARLLSAVAAALGACRGSFS